MSKNRHKHTSLSPQRPTKFHGFLDCAKWLKKSVYLIARGRQNSNKSGYDWLTIGSSFIAAPNRLITCSHVINDPNNPDPIAHHLDGDKYYLVRHDDFGNSHWHITEPMLNKELFDFPDTDLAVLYLKDNFYKNSDTGQVFADKNDFIRLNTTFYPIGLDVGILGYPLCKLEFENRDVFKPKLGNILLRGEKGIINCRYQDPKSIETYEFTMAFNPGNSGGPIFDIETGEAVSIVRGYRTIRIKINEVLVDNNLSKIIKNYKEKEFIESINAIYSTGFAISANHSALKTHSVLSY